MNNILFEYNRMNPFEQELLDNPNKLSFMNNLLTEHQFSEEFLIKTIDYYDSWKCLRSQNNLSPYFCFRYLYDNDTDSADDWTDFNMISNYLKKRNYTDNQIDEQFNLAMQYR
jgi:hypothetical protein